MSHKIEMRTLDSGEIGSFVASRAAGWHLLGHVADKDLSIDEAIKILNPGQIVKMPIYSDFILPSGPTMVPMAGKNGTYRVRDAKERLAASWLQSTSTNSARTYALLKTNDPEVQDFLQKSIGKTSAVSW